MHLAYWLFSQTKTTGSDFTAGKFNASWNEPLFTAPSPKKQTATWPFAAVDCRQAGSDRDPEAAADDAVGAEHPE